MEELAYDTLREERELEAAGLTGGQAKAIVGTVNRAMTIIEQISQDVAAIKSRIDNEMVTRADLEHFATKADLEHFATRADLEHFATRADLEHFATRVDLADLRTEIAEGFGSLRAELKDSIASVYRTVIWVMGGSFGGFAAILAAMRIWG